MQNDIRSESTEKSKEMGRSRYSSIAMIDYFNAIERLCKEKEINPENIDLSFKVHWLRNAVGGSFARSQEMFAEYQKYVKEVPEEARYLDIPDEVKVALGDIISYITWHYRRSYTAIQNDSVKKAEARSMQLEEEVTQLLQRLEQSATDMDELKLENQALQGRLEIRDSTVKELETRLNVAEAELETCHHQLDSTRHELSLAQQSNDSLSQQLAERKTEIAGHLEYQKKLNEEINTQRSDNAGLSRQCDQLSQTVSDTKAERDRFEQELIAAQNLCTELKSALSGKEGDLVAVNAELTELHKLNESLSADLNKVTLVSQGYEAEVLNKAMNSKRSRPK
ncbi:ATP/GTP-binding protein [Escherichia coli]|uniref:ATP/GTP-binding protein n=1 Tax=Escherichia coli TaxID=562 RepID=UPI0023DA472B|nr:ATP/GTP-binding protein [Escherichia coli]WEN26334.1 ATP/GTP-binding protein [Escherichia coli]